MKQVGRADRGPRSSQLPVQPNTAIAAVGNLARMRSRIPAGTVPDAAPGLSLR